MSAEHGQLPLSQALRAGTQQLHRRAEQAGVMARLLQGEVSLEAYAPLLASLLPIYEALEQALQNRPAALQPLLARLPDEDQLWRSAKLHADLQTLEHERRHVPGASLGGAAQAHGLALGYAKHLAHLALTEPALLAAHVYLRYLGDLHGGQVLARLVRKGLAEQRTSRGVPSAVDAVALRFYDFGSQQQVNALLAGLREGLDALELSPKQREAMLIEACQGFERHIELFNALDEAQ